MQRREHTAPHHLQYEHEPETTSHRHIIIRSNNSTSKQRMRIAIETSHFGPNRTSLDQLQKRSNLHHILYTRHIIPQIRKSIVFVYIRLNRITKVHCLFQQVVFFVVLFQLIFHFIFILFVLFFHVLFDGLFIFESVLGPYWECDVDVSFGQYSTIFITTHIFLQVKPTNQKTTMRIRPPDKFPCTSYQRNRLNTIHTNI
mmetsp:Transcript_4795/g.7253  ORF Transcript_4795/g.7253 Transcript_4795/m.7253 type:complete len:200 (-) Transcript_4795:424-1023(-)